MMQSVLYILAAENHGSFVVFLIIFAVIWGIRAMAAISKKVQTPPGKQPPVKYTGLMAPPAIPRPLRAPPLPAARRPQDVRAALAQQQRAASLAQMAPRLIPAAQALAQMTAPPPRPPAAPAAPAQSAKTIAPPDTLPAYPVLRPKPGVNAAALRKWLTPKTLQQQFMLTELFQPPKALRDEREHA